MKLIEQACNESSSSIIRKLDFIDKLNVFLSLGNASSAISAVARSLGRQWKGITKKSKLSQN